MKSLERKQALVSILVNQLRDEYFADIEFMYDNDGRITGLTFGVPYHLRFKAMPLYFILKSYLRPSARRRRKK